VYLLVFRADINEMYGSRSKTPVKNLVRQRCAEGFNSGVKRLMWGTSALLIVHGVYGSVPWQFIIQP
jgi:hypothetical protein